MLGFLLAREWPGLSLLKGKIRFDSISDDLTAIRAFRDG